MRTTIIIPDTIFTRAKALARLKGIQLSQFISEALELRLLAEDNRKNRKNRKFSINTFSMGQPSININNREELFTVMDD